MTTLLLLAAVVITFSGLIPLVAVSRRSLWDGVLYGAVVGILMVNTALVTVYHFDDLVALLASNVGAADWFVGGAQALKVAARGLILVLLSRAVLLEHRRHPLWWFGLPVLWASLSAFDLAAWVFDLSFLGLAGVLVYRRWPSPLVAYFPVKMLVLLIDAGTPGGLAPGWSIGVDLLFFFALNLGLYRPLLRPSNPGSSPPSPSWASDNLSPRERETAELLAQQLSYKAIADRLNISVDTVKSHAKAVYRKTGCADRRELARPKGDSPQNHPTNHPGS